MRANSLPTDDFLVETAEADAEAIKRPATRTESESLTMLSNERKKIGVEIDDSSRLWSEADGSVAPEPLLLIPVNGLSLSTAPPLVPTSCGEIELATLIQLFIIRKHTVPVRLPPSFPVRYQNYLLVPNLLCLRHDRATVPDQSGSPDDTISQRLTCA